MGSNNFLHKLKIHLSFKNKLILIILIITLLPTVVGISSFAFQRATIDKLNVMVETMIVANEVVEIAQEIPYTVTHYNLYKEYQDRSIINDYIVRMKTKLAFVHKNVHGDGQSSFYTLNRLTENYFKLTQESVIYLDSGGKMEDASYLSSLNQTLSSIRTTIQQLIANELSRYLTIKKNLDRQSTFIGVLITLAFLTITGLCMFTTIRYINRVGNTIVRIADTAQQIAGGDLQVNFLEMQSDDEFSSLVQSFNKMTENLRSIIGSINSHSTQVSLTAENLKTGAEQSSAASEQIAATMEQFSKGASEQAVKSQQTAEAAKRLFQSHHNVIGNADEVLTAAGKAAKAAKDGNETIIGLIEQIEKIETEISSIQVTTDLLRKHSDEIEEILQVMTDMAEHINLLSLNASIEAVRAGEFGKGFAVVANQVRKIAADSTQAVNGISNILSDIQKESQEVTRKMSVGVVEVVAGTKMAQDARIAFEKIVDTSKVSNLKVKEISLEIQKMVDEIRHVQVMSESIANIAVESSAESEEVAAAAEEQTAGSEEILSFASLLHNLASGLHGVVQKFKL